MKTIKLLSVLLTTIVIASCGNPVEKAVGDYDGTASIGPLDYSATFEITANGDAVDLYTEVDGGIFEATAMVPSHSGSNVVILYNNENAMIDEISSLSATITGNDITCTMQIMMGADLTYGINFVGTK